MLTRNGVAKDLPKSPYVFTALIDGKRLDLFFSSKLHLDSFKNKRQENYKMIYNYLYKRFKFKTDCRLLSDCNLYQKVETRGFYIKFNNKEFKCQNTIILSGGLKMKKKLGEWQEILMIS